MKRLPILFTVILLVMCCCRHRGHDEAKNLGWGMSSGHEQETLDEVEVTYSDGFVPPSNPSRNLPPNNNTALGEYFNDSNYIQYAVAEQLGIEPIVDLTNAYLTRRPLVEIESTDHYTVDHLTHSMPYLVPEAAALLDEIGREFTAKAKKADGRDGYKVIVTSMLRTPATVRKLRRVNKNATDSSTHMFATTFDLSWSRFESPDTSNGLSNERLKMLLAEVLRDKREEGRCYVKYEKKSPCFHITATK